MPDDQKHFGSLDGLRVLDAFAGTGAMGFEALSRGAESAELVEKDTKACGALAANITTLKAERQARVHRGTAAKFLATRAGREPQWDIVFLDPPYDVPNADLLELIALLEPLVDPEGLFVVERSVRSRFEWPKEIEPLREKRYGETQIWYGR